MMLGNNPALGAGRRGASCSIAFGPYDAHLLAGCTRRGRVLCAEPRPGQGFGVSELHNQLLREIEERRRSQAELLKKVDKLSSGVTEDTPQQPNYSTLAPIASPSAPRPALYLEPEPPMPEPIVAEVPKPKAPRAEPLAGPNAMNVVMVGAECAPWSKTGGLGDVMGALPKALARRGHRVMVVAPRYHEYPDAWETSIRVRFNVFGGSQEVGFFHSYVDGVDFVFVDHPAYLAMGKDVYGGDRQSLAFRNALLCKAALEAVWSVPLGGVPYGDDNLVFVANDWHTALLPVYLQAHYRDYGKMQYARCLFVIHNMAHQGRAPFDEVRKFELNEHYQEMFRLYDPIGGEHMNIMKVGLQTAHRLVAVSQGYAWECQTQDGGWGLDAVVRDASWKLRGIINGIDLNEWNPATDEYLKSDGYANYDIHNFVEGKRKCKLALQRELGLPQDPDAPLLGFIGRLDYQKGVDLIRDSCEWLMGERVQLVMLGSGRQDLEDSLRHMEATHREGCRAWVGFSVKVSHRITAAADILLMPSRFEPCGLNQLYAMHYGTVPVVHAVGGLRDTVKPFNAHDNNTGTGWTFERGEAHLMRGAISQAINTYRNNRPAFQGVARRGMEQDLSWDNAAKQYEEAMVEAKYQW